ENDDRHLRLLTKSFDHRKAVPVRQAEVENDEIGLVHLRPGQCVRAARRLRKPVALGPEARAQEAPDLRLVVHDENMRLRAHDRRSSSPAGNMMVNCAPRRSIRLAAVMRPPNASTKPRQTASP